MKDVLLERTCRVQLQLLPSSARHSLLDVLPGRLNVDPGCCFGIAPAAQGVVRGNRPLTVEHGRDLRHPQVLRLWATT